MSVAHLSTFGWCVLALTFANALGFVVRLCMRRWAGADIHVMMLAILLVISLWMVST